MAMVGALTFQVALAGEGVRILSPPRRVIVGIFQTNCTGFGATMALYPNMILWYDDHLWKRYAQHVNKHFLPQTIEVFTALWTVDVIHITVLGNIFLFRKMSQIAGNGRAPKIDKSTGYLAFRRSRCQHIDFPIPFSMETYILIGLYVTLAIIHLV